MTHPPHRFVPKWGRKAWWCLICDQTEHRGNHLPDDDRQRGGAMTADPTPEAIRQALDVLRLDADEIREWDTPDLAFGRSVELADRIRASLAVRVAKLDTSSLEVGDGDA